MESKTIVIGEEYALCKDFSLEIPETIQIKDLDLFLDSLKKWISKTQEVGL